MGYLVLLGIGIVVFAYVWHINEHGAKRKQKGYDGFGDPLPDQEEKETKFPERSCVICKEELTLWEQGDNEEIWKCGECNTEQIFKKNPKTGKYIK